MITLLTISVDMLAISHYRGLGKTKSDYMKKPVHIRSSITAVSFIFIWSSSMVESSEDSLGLNSHDSMTISLLREQIVRTVLLHCSLFIRELHETSPSDRRFLVCEMLAITEALGCPTYRIFLLCISFFYAFLQVLNVSIGR